MLEISVHTDSAARGMLFMDERRVRSITRLSPAGIVINQRFAPDRERVASFIASTYRREYGSVISHQYPMLMSVRDAGGAILAALGFRLAAEEPLFLEQYLPQPVESCVRRAFGTSFDRTAIVEIGNLASAGNGASVFLFVALAAYLRAQGLCIAAVTGTTNLRRLLLSFGVEFVELGRADPAALCDRGESWGTYYQRDPKVIAGAIEPAYGQLEPFLPPEHNGNLEHLFSRVHPRTQEAMR